MHELESVLSDEQRRHGDTQKNVRKQDKRIKELIMQVRLKLLQQTDSA